MATIEPEITFKIWGTGEELRFSDTDDLIGWAESEKARWQLVLMPTNPRLAKLKLQQENAFGAIANAAREQAFDAARASITGLQQGTVVTSGNAFFPAISTLGATDGDVAGLLLVRARSDSAAQLSSLGINAPYDLLLKLAAIGPTAGSLGSFESISQQLDRSRGLLNDIQGAVADLRKAKASLEDEIVSIRKRFSDDQEKRASEWVDQTESAKKDWLALKKVYDTELGLRAPTTYWTSRGASQFWQALVYGLIFTILSSAFVGAFLKYGVPFLQASDKDSPLASVLIPLLIPAFAAIWMLRILGRLLSESLQLMRDAKERETLVKTFLALMKDESTGKSVVKEEDRILILHALFRPSSVVAADDAPPVHWFDVLANKVGQRK